MSRLEGRSSVSGSHPLRFLPPLRMGRLRIHLASPALALRLTQLARAGLACPFLAPVVHPTPLLRLHQPKHSRPPRRPPALPPPMNDNRHRLRIMNHP